MENTYRCKNLIAKEGGGLVSKGTNFQGDTVNVHNNNNYYYYYDYYW